MLHTELAGLLISSVICSPRDGIIIAQILLLKRWQRMLNIFVTSCEGFTDIHRSKADITLSCINCSGLQYYSWDSGREYLCCPDFVNIVISCLVSPRLVLVGDWKRLIPEPWNDVTAAVELGCGLRYPALYQRTNHFEDLQL